MCSHGLEEINFIRHHEDDIKKKGVEIYEIKCSLYQTKFAKSDIEEVKEKDRLFSHHH